MNERTFQGLPREADRMRPATTFEFYLDDDRYAVPTLKLIDARDEAEALSLADALLRESPHHRGAELCLGGQRLAGLGTFAMWHATR